MSRQIIDLSEHNGNFNLQILKDNGVSGVILRLCWLGNKNNHTVDKQIKNYYKQAKEIGLNIDFYVYSYCETLDALKSGLEYIDRIIEELGIATGHTIFLDLEDPQIENLSREELTKQAEFFCNYMILRGFKAGIYANKYWFENKLDVNRLLNYKIWLAQWGVSEPNVSFKIDIWQYTNNLYIDEKRFDSNYDYSEEKPIIEGGFDMKTYSNGSTPEIVYQDLMCTKQIGYLHPYEKASCYAIINDKALIVYKVDNSNNQKSGFVKWLGGIQNG